MAIPTDPRPAAPDPADEGTDADWWGAAQATCDLCNREWTAVYHMRCDSIECPECGHMTRAPHLVDLLEDEERESWRSPETDP